MKAKCNYESPYSEIIHVQIEQLCDWIHQSGPSDDFAKNNDIDFDDWDWDSEEDDDSGLYESLWDD